jgi:tetratricopeptide (TPR) repeat protein
VGTAAPPRAGYRADLGALRRRRLEHEATADPTSPATATELLTLRHREVSLAGGRPDELLALGDDVDRAVRRFPGWPDLRLLRATLALAVHRSDVARAALTAVPELSGLPAGRVLAADLATFDGDYAVAREGYLQAAREEPGWDVEARLASLAVATGDVRGAEDRYAAAEDDLTAKQLRSFAWVRVQRAELALRLGDLARAGRFLDDAEAAYPGWWYVAAHRAAVDSARGRPEDAVAGYRAVLAEVDRPEFREALGTALLAVGRPEEAAACHAAALAVYSASAARGEVHYLHHLAAFCADVRPDPPAAVTWAQADVRLRRTGATLSLLAWCLYRAGRTAEALAAVEEAEALGADDPRLRARAREIRHAASTRALSGHPASGGR